MARKLVHPQRQPVSAAGSFLEIADWDESTPCAPEGGWVNITYRPTKAPGRRSWETEVRLLLEHETPDPKAR